MNLDPIPLEGEHVRLEPLSAEDHLADLARAGADESIFRWFADSYATGEKLAGFVDEALDAQENGDSLPFAIVSCATDTAIGSARFCAIEPEKRRVEIGWMWITPQWQRTAANTEATYLMLRHAFEAWDCVRVEFETAAENSNARRALKRIGATEEGTLRKHMIVQGELRDSVFFSVIDVEWEAVRAGLAERLASGSG